MYMCSILKRKVINIELPLTTHFYFYLFIYLLIYLLIISEGFLGRRNNGVIDYCYKNCVYCH